MMILTINVIVTSIWKYEPLLVPFKGRCHWLVNSKGCRSLKKDMKRLNNELLKVGFYPKYKFSKLSKEKKQILKEYKGLRLTYKNC